MKKILTILMFVCAMGFNALAQTDFRSISFDEALKVAAQENKLVFIDFYTDWCGPCKMLAPIIETLATEYEGKIKIGKLNVDDAPNTAQNYGVMSIPTLLYIKNGEVVNKSVGVVSKATIEEILNNL